MSDIRPPLQAQVVEWHVKPGDHVNAGDLLVILEAMKMEHSIAAPHDGRVAEIHFKAGEQVDEGVELLQKPVSQAELASRVRELLDKALS